MSSINKVILVGNLGKDPETTSNDRGTIVRLSVATSDRWKDKNTGEQKERTEWHSVVIFNEGLTKVASRYLTKGSKVYIEGKLRTRKWQDQQGNDRYSTEVVLENFGGSLVMLSGGREAGADEGSDEIDDRRDAPGDQRSRGDWQAPSGRGRSAPIASPKEKAAATGRSFSKTMDDEIPF